jgi:hypothetical protein
MSDRRMKVDKPRINESGENSIYLMIKLRMIENDFCPCKYLGIISINLVNLLTDITDNLFPPALLNGLEYIIV